MDTALMNMKMSPELNRILSQFPEQNLVRMQELVKEIDSPAQITGIAYALKAMFLQKIDSNSATRKHVDQYVDEFMNLIARQSDVKGEGTGLLLNPYLVSI